MANRIGADLIVVGHRYRSRFAKWWSEDEESTLLHKVSCSILVAMELPALVNASAAFGEIAAAASRRRSRLMITLAVMSATLIQVLDTTIVNVALPHMQGELGATSDQISWVLTSYLVSSAIFMPLTGYFTDIWGRKRFLLICIAGFVAASALCGMSQNVVADRALPPAAGHVRRGAGAAVPGDHGRRLSTRRNAARPWRSGDWA